MRLTLKVLFILFISTQFLLSADYHFIDSIGASTKFTITGGTLKIFVAPEYYNEISQSDYLNTFDSYSYSSSESKIQKGRGLDYNCPFYHAATWVRAGIDFRYAGFTVNPNLILEHRAQSWGIFDKASLNTIPMLYLGYDTSVSVLGQKINFGMSLGTYEDLKTMEGLLLYNMDVQGVNIYFKTGDIHLWLQNVSDLLGSYGLGIDDLFQFGIGLEEYNLGSGIKMDLKAAANVYASIKSRNDQLLDIDVYGVNDGTSYSISSALYNKNFRLYGQFGIRSGYKYEYELNPASLSRTINETTTFMEKTAFLAGAGYSFETEDLKIHGNLEYRYYGNYFNLGLMNTHYADYSEDGDGNIYPLYMIDKPFGQFAVFTEYQGRKVSCISFNTEIKYNVWQKFMLNASLDLNHLDASGIDAYLYPFQSYSLSYEPVDKTYLMFGFTNKTINQNKHYPALYLFETLHGFFTIRFDF